MHSQVPVQGPYSNAPSAYSLEAVDSDQKNSNNGFTANVVSLYCILCSVACVVSVAAC